MAVNTSRSIQFTDVDSVVTAYLTKKTPRFGLFQGGQFLFKYEGNNLQEGSEQLQAFIEMLAQSAAIYTVAVYEEHEGKINSRTPYDGSFNFRLQQDTVPYNNGGVAVRQLQEKILLLEEKLSLEEPEEKSQLDSIGEVLMHPVTQMFLPVVGKIFGIDLNAAAAAMQGHQVAGAQVAGIPANAQTLQECIEVLERNGMDVEEILHKLAVTASTNPHKFKLILDAIKTFQV